MLGTFLVGSLALALWIGLAARSEKEGSGTGSGGGRIPSLARTLESLVTSEGFQFEHQKSGEIVFRLAGERFEVGKDGWMSIGGVKLELFEEKKSFRVRAGTGRFREADRQATLSGGVEIETPEGTKLEASEASLLESGQRLVAEGPISIDGPEWRGSAGRFELLLDRRQYRIEGSVRLEAREVERFGGHELRAQEVLWSAPEGQFRASGEVELRGRWGRVQCGQAVFFLDPATGHPRNAVLQWEVRGERSGRAPDGTPLEPAIRWYSEEARADFLPGGSALAQVTLEARVGELVRLLQPLPDGTIRELAARYVVSTYRDGQPVETYAFRPVYVSEYVESESSTFRRRGQADQVSLEYSATGEPSRVTLQGAVELQEGGARLQAERAFFDLQSGRLEILGEPAHLVEARGEIRAPRMVREAERDLLKAEGGVRAMLSASEWRSILPDTHTQEPIRVEAQEGLWTVAPRSAFFQGRVQAWQGGAVLFADQVRLEAEASGPRLSASGGVRTVWERGSTEKSGEAPRGSVQITARVLSYRPEERRLDYLEGVEARQGSRILKAGQLACFLDSERRLERWWGRDGVVVVDPETRSRIESDSVEYSVQNRKARFLGEPVRLTDPRGRVEGKLLEYDLESGAARWLASEGG